MTPAQRRGRARRLTPLRLLIAAVLLVDALALGAHEVAIHSAPCMWGPWPIAHCRVLGG